MKKLLKNTCFLLFIFLILKTNLFSQPFSLLAKIKIDKEFLAYIWILPYMDKNLIYGEASSDGEKSIYEREKKFLSFYFDGNKLKEYPVNLFKPLEGKQVGAGILNLEERYLIIGEEKGIIKFYTFDGDYIFSEELKNEDIHRIFIGNLDEDIKKEIVVITLEEKKDLEEEKWHIHVFDYENRLKEKFEVSFGFFSEYELEPDSLIIDEERKIILFATADGGIFGIDKGKIFKIAKLKEGWMISSLFIEDVDRDGNKELVVTTVIDEGKYSYYQGNLLIYKIKKDGYEIFWSSPIDDRAYTSSNIGDIDGDGKLEIVVGANKSDFEKRIWEGSLLILKWDGKEKKIKRIYESEILGTMINNVVIFDFLKGDGKEEIIYCSVNIIPHDFLSEPDFYSEIGIFQYNE